MPSKRFVSVSLDSKKEFRRGVERVPRTARNNSLLYDGHGSAVTNKDFALVNHTIIFVIY